MGIYVRRGMEADFDPEKMKPGEWAVSINTDRRKQKIWMCFAPGVVKRMGTYEDFADQIEDATDEIKNKYLETFNEILKDMKTNKDLVETDYNFVKEFKEQLENTYMKEIAASVKAASSSAASASTSASSASDSATAAAGSADESRKYSESWKGSLLPKGVVSFSQLPASGMVAGHLYGVKEPFLTDSRFEEGVGHHYPQWTCVYWTQNNKWKVLSGVLSLEITEAEYNALSEAEQKNGTIYYVKDADNTIEADEINGLADWAKAKTKPTYSADEVGLGNVGNFKAVSTVASQGLTDTEKSNARANIGAQASGNYAPSIHNHDDRYYTESEIDAKLKEKVNNNADGADSLLSKITEEWTAAPTDNTNFIRQDTGGKNEFGRVKFSTLWTYIKGKADKVYSAIGHKHIKADITDFPTSMAANGGNSTTVNGHTVNSDVPANAKFTDTNTWRPQPDWNVTSGDAAIKNKPSLGTAASKNIEDFAVVKILEEAKYNALSEAEQKNGTIYFTY